MRSDFLRAKYNDISVFHSAELNGGGTTHGQQFIPVVRALFGKVSRVFEFCAGPGYIGFSILSEKLCDKLCLSDINPLAIDAIRQTIAANKLERAVTCFLSDGLKAIPESETFELVISNPPHYAGGVPRGIIANDVDWKLHAEFYSAIKKYLSPNGSILVLENYHGSTEHDFLPMIESAGLSLFQSFMYLPMIPAIANPYYFLWIRRKDRLLSENSYPAGKTITVSLPSKDTVQLEAHTKYVFELLDQRDRDVGLKNGMGVIFFRLKPFVSIRKQKGVSCASLFTNGDFVLYDLATSETLLKVIVNSEGG